MARSAMSSERSRMSHFFQFELDDGWHNAFRRLREFRVERAPQRAVRISPSMRMCR